MLHNLFYQNLDLNQHTSCSDPMSNVAQRKRAGLITRRTLDRNQSLLLVLTLEHSEVSLNNFLAPGKVVLSDFEDRRVMDTARNKKYFACDTKPYPYHVGTPIGDLRARTLNMRS
jgi:hypothetical protein